MASPSNIHTFYTVDLDNNGYLYVLADYRNNDTGNEEIYYAKLNSSDGLIVFNKLITTNADDELWYSNGHKSLVYSDNSVLITGYSYATASARATDLVAIKVPNEDLIPDGNYDRWSINTPELYQVVVGPFDVTDTGFSLVPASILQDGVPRTITDSEITGDEITILAGNLSFQVKTEGQLNINDAFVFPTISGRPGQVLKYPSIGNKLVWGNGGSGNLQTTLDAGNTASDQSMLFTNTGFYDYKTYVSGYGISSYSDYYGWRSNIGYGYVSAQRNGVGRSTILAGSLYLDDFVNGGSAILSGAFTRSNSQVLPDKSGTFAMLDDITGGSQNLAQVTEVGSTFSNDIQGIGSAGTETINLSPANNIIQVFSTDGTESGNIQPAALVFTTTGGGVFVTPPTSPMSGTYNQQLQAKDGTIALLSDITGGGTASLNDVVHNGNTTDTAIVVSSGGENGVLNSSLIYTWHSNGMVGISNQDTSPNSTQNGIFFSPNGGAYNARLNYPHATSLTASITWTLPDKSGTVAMLSDIIPVSITGSVGTLQQVLNNSNTATFSINLTNPNGSIIEIVPNKEIITGHFDPYFNLQSGTGSYVRMWSGGGIGAPPTIVLANNSGGSVTLFNSGFSVQSFNFGTINGTLAVTDQLKYANYNLSYVQLNSATYSVATSNNVVSDYHIDVNTSVVCTYPILLPSVSLYPNGTTLVITDIAGFANTHPIVIKAAGTDHIQTVSTGTYSISNSYGSITIHSQWTNNLWVITSKI